VIKVIFCDLGGVLLTNGWDHAERGVAVQHFKLDLVEFSKRHEMVFSGYEEGKMTMDDYLHFTVFHIPRPFSKADFKSFMKEQSKKLPDMLEALGRVKKKNNVRVFCLSNEGRELGDYRIRKFKLRTIMDTFIVSGFVGMRKPSLELYNLAINLAQVKPDEALYIDDREVLIEAGQLAGLATICHKSPEETLKEMEKYGLHV